MLLNFRNFSEFPEISVLDWFLPWLIDRFARLSAFPISLLCFSLTSINK